MVQKRAVILGGTGAIGRELCKSLSGMGFELTIVSRDIEKSKESVFKAKKFVQYDINNPKGLSKAIDGSSVVVNLSGAPIFGKWRGNYENEVIDSRVKGTEYVVKAMEEAKSKPEVFVNGSAAGFYGYSKNVAVDELSGAGSDFWAELVKKWEEEALKAEKFNIRTVLIRTTLVLQKDEGALGVLVPYFKRGLGGYVRPGDQIFSWVGIEDEIGIILKVIENEGFSGPINCVSGTVSSKEFSNAIGKIMGKRGSLPIPGFIIKSMFGKAADLVLKSQIVSSSRMKSLDYTIQGKSLEDTLRKSM